MVPRERDLDYHFGLHLVLERAVPTPGMVRQQVLALRTVLHPASLHREADECCAQVQESHSPVLPHPHQAGLRAGRTVTASRRHCSLLDLVRCPVMRSGPEDQWGRVAYLLPSWRFAVARGRALRVCTVSGCPEYTDGGRCPEHRLRAERKRGSATQRGYGQEHRRRFRAGVLARDPVCVVCRRAPATEADHWPLSRRELVDQGLDADDPARGRGLCKPCHSRETAAHQPGGAAAE
jgi:5-methylcytosine-specific restriction protein A